jgi:hypothetical protein
MTCNMLPIIRAHPRRLPAIPGLLCESPVKQGEDGLPSAWPLRLTSADRPTFGEKPDTGNSVDRAIHPTSAKQGRIRSVGYRIDFQLRYIARKEAYPSPGSEHDICQIFNECAGVAGN